ncbi:MAG TPA: toast rack family protein [candidate division Zixibacteria bacterium]|nr:toast rack family protein [candidate division Zixibacteria bacterium]
MSRSVIFVLTFLFAATTSFAGKIERATEAVSPKEAKSMEIDGNLGAGTFKITTDNITELAMFDIEYDDRAVRYNVDYYEKGERGILTFESDRRGNWNANGEENKWNIVLSDKYESILNLDIGACDAKFDFGGLPLRELNIDMGAASGLIEFSKPNPIRMDDFKMDAGASSLDMGMIGNANFGKFEFNGGVGSFNLDFRGKYEGESEISIEIGLGSAEITLPASIPIRIESGESIWLSSVEFHGDPALNIEDDEYESEDFEKSKTRIILHLIIGLGSADVYFKN